MAFENEAAKKILSEIDRDERVGIDYEIDVSKSFLGHEGKGVEPLVQSGRRDLRISLRRKDQAASAGSGEFC
jgi:hypothetical protein